MLERAHKVSDPLLTLGFSVLAERAKNINLNHFRNKPTIFISIQNPNQSAFTFPNLAKFEHIERNTVGVAKSRNEVLKAATTKYLIFGDDDIIFKEDALEMAVKFLEENPSCDLILGCTVNEDGLLRKNYPTSERKLTRYNSAKAATYEMMIRVDSFREKNLQFDENFGAGAENYLGDEYILITDLLKAGGKGVFLPLVFTYHPHDSSGSGWGSSRDLKARAIVFDRIFGFWAIPVRAAFILRPKRSKISITKKLNFILNKSN